MSYNVRPPHSADDPAQPPPGALASAPGTAVLPVSLLVSSARLLIERHLGLAWVSGEISNFSRASSGHCYFNLKDAKAQVRCVMFRQKAQFIEFALRDGLGVEVRATPSIYEARGEFQLTVENVRLAGVGVLYEKFARLKARLEQAGWFSAARKRVLPIYPRIIGVVTSPRAAALRDIVATLARRWPSARVILYPTNVQGGGAATEIAAAIRTANAHGLADVLIVARGGGSIEDLWAFNEELVAEAVFSSVLPVVSGVGHETDFTICDFVADLRAPTPTAAAAAVTPDCSAVADRVISVARRFIRAGRHQRDVRLQRLDVAARCLVHPAARLAAQRERLADLSRRLAQRWRATALPRAARLATLHARLAREMRAPLPAAHAVERLRTTMQRAGRERIAHASRRLDQLAQNLAHLNPQAVLERGYAIVATAEGVIVQDAAQLAPGDAVAMTFARGGADATVTRRRT